MSSMSDLDAQRRIASGEIKKAADRVRIFEDGCPNYVIVRYPDGSETRYHCPLKGGYVRHDDGSQVCEMLASRGNTLWIGKGQRLIDVIRRERRAEMRRWCSI